MWTFASEQDSSNAEIKIVGRAKPLHEQYKPIRGILSNILRMATLTRFWAGWGSFLAPGRALASCTVAAHTGGDTKTSANRGCIAHSTPRSRGMPGRTYDVRGAPEREASVYCK